MQKARFLDPQPPVRLVEKGGKVYVFLCLNEQAFEETYEGSGPVTVYEYTYHEFAEDADVIDVQDVQSHPEKYMTYAPEPDTLEANQWVQEQIQAAITQAVSQAVTLTGGTT